jgi:hypothetical protein
VSEKLPHQHGVPIKSLSSSTLQRRKLFILNVFLFQQRNSLTQIVQYKFKEHSDINVAVISTVIRQLEATLRLLTIKSCVVEKNYKLQNSRFSLFMKKNDRWQQQKKIDRFISY